MAKKLESPEKIIIQEDPDNEEKGYRVVPASDDISTINIDLSGTSTTITLPEPEFKPKKIQTGESWIDDKDIYVDKKRVFSHEITAERNAVKIYNESIKVQKSLKSLYELLNQSTNKVQGTETDDLKPKKNFTFYSFDKSVKVEKLVQSLPEYDNDKIKSAKEKFDLYIDKTKKDEVDGYLLGIVELIKSAFETKSGKFDKSKLGILIGQKKIKDETFQEAVKELEGAIQTNREKTYYNVYVKMGHEYIQINLRLSGVK